MNRLVEYAPGLAIATVAAGLLGYAIALVLAAFFSGKEGSLGARLSAWFDAGRQRCTIQSKRSWKDETPSYMQERWIYPSMTRRWIGRLPTSS
jgi:hypothetical protein